MTRSFECPIFAFRATTASCCPEIVGDHHSGDPEKIEKVTKINCYLIQQFTYLLDKLKAAKEGDGTLLDHSMIAYDSGLADGNRREHHNLPLILAGRGNGTLKPGRMVRYPDETPITNLYVAMLDRMGVPVEALGDSTRLS